MAATLSQWARYFHQPHYSRVSMDDCDIYENPLSLDEQETDTGVGTKKGGTTTSPLEKKYMLIAKIKALEEYVANLETTIKGQEDYIMELEEMRYTPLKRRPSF